MSLTLLVENNSKIESFYRLNLSVWLGLKIEAKTNALEASKYLESDSSDIKLIIVRNMIEKEETANIIMKFLKEKGFNIPVIEIGAGPAVDGSISRVTNSLDLKALIQSCAKSLNITAKDMTTKVVPDFFPIPIEYFKHIKLAYCPIYIQDPSNKEKYDLKFKKNACIQKNDIQILIENDTSELFVNKMDRLEFVNFVTSELIAELEDKALSPDEEMMATTKNVELLSKKIMSVGINEDTVKLAHKSMDTMRRNVKSNPKLSKLLDRLLSNKTSYLFKHTQILTYIGLHIVKNIEWGNAEQADKISFLAFFHDIALENDEQARIKSTLDLKKSQLPPKEKTLVEKHALIAAELITKFPHAPMGADQLIRQHHGNLNGIGFSEHHGSNISPVAVVFIVAEEYTRIILNCEEGPFDNAKMLRELKEEFSTSRFQKVIETLQTINF